MWTDTEVTNVVPMSEVYWAYSPSQSILCTAFREVQVSQSGLMSRRALVEPDGVPTQRRFLLSADKAQGTVDF